MILIVGNTGPLSSILKMHLFFLGVDYITLGRDGVKNSTNVSLSYDVLSSVKFKYLFFLSSSIKSNHVGSLDLLSLPELKILRFVYANISFKKIVLFSSAGSVYGSFPGVHRSEDALLNPISNYGLSKKILEEYVVSRSLDNFIILRISNPIGTYSGSLFDYGLIPLLFRNSFDHVISTITSPILHSKDYFSIKDLISFLELIIKDQSISGIYNVGSGVPRSLKQVIDDVGCFFSYDLKFDVKINPNAIGVDANIGFLDVSKMNNIVFSISNYYDELENIYNYYKKTR